jgi:hypothetical protein
MSTPKKKEEVPVVEQKIDVPAPTSESSTGMASVNVPADQKKKEVTESFDSYFQDEE